VRGNNASMLVMREGVHAGHGLLARIFMMHLSCDGHRRYILASSHGVEFDVEKWQNNPSAT